MAFYRCFIRGEHFPGECIGQKGVYGFYTTRWVEALNKEEAELRAVDLLREDRSLALPEGAAKPADARVYVEEIEEVDELPESTGGGATWFSEAGESETA